MDETIMRSMVQCGAEAHCSWETPTSGRLPRRLG